MIRLIGGAGICALVLCALCASALGAPGFAGDETLAGGHSNSPVVAFAANGYAAVAWVESGAGGQSAVRVALRPPGGPWSAPQSLGAGGSDKYSTSVAVDAAGDAAVAWQDRTSTNVNRATVATRPAGGAFGAPEALADGTGGESFMPAVGIDGAGHVTLLYSPHPDVAERVFAAGSSALAATSHQVSPGCSTFIAMRLAVAPSGDAVAGYDCIVSSAIFAWRHDGAWAVSPIMSSASGACPAPSTSVTPLDVAIDASGEPVGLVQTTTSTPDFTTCTPFITTSELRLLLPAGGVLTPLGGDPAASGTAFGGGFPFSGGDVAIRPGEILLALGSSAAGFGPYQPQVRSFNAAGAPAGPAQPVGSPTSLGFGDPRIALAPDGRALLAWTDSPGGGAATTTLASVRAPGGTFDAPATVSAGTVSPGSPTADALDDAGDGAVVYAQGASPALVHVRAYDATPPALGAVTIPSGATPGAPAAFAVSASDFWGPVALTWSFGDGSGAIGGAPAHAFAQAGTFTATVTATDAAGNAVSQSGVVHVTAAAVAAPARPVLSRAGLTHARFRVGTRPTAISAAKPDVAAKRRRAPVGTTFRFRLNEAATVTIAIEGDPSPAACPAAAASSRPAVCAHTAAAPATSGSARSAATPRPAPTASPSAVASAASRCGRAPTAPRSRPGLPARPAPGGASASASCADTREGVRRHMTAQVRILAA